MPDSNKTDFFFSVESRSGYVIKSDTNKVMEEVSTVNPLVLLQDMPVLKFTF